MLLSMRGSRDGFWWGSEGTSAAPVRPMAALAVKTRRSGRRREEAFESIRARTRWTGRNAILGRGIWCPPRCGRLCGRKVREREDATTRTWTGEPAVHVLQGNAGIPPSAFGRLSRECHEVSVEVTAAENPHRHCELSRKRGGHYCSVDRRFPALDGTGMCQK